MPNSVEIDHNSRASTSIAGSIREQKLENPKSDFRKRTVLICINCDFPKEPTKATQLEAKGEGTKLAGWYKPCRPAVEGGMVKHSEENSEEQLSSKDKDHDATVVMYFV